MTRPRPAIKPGRHAFPGHSLVRHGPGDWRCKCGVPLKSWRFAEPADGVARHHRGERIEMTGRKGAREAMFLHRAGLRLRSNAQ